MLHAYLLFIQIVALSCVSYFIWYLFWPTIDGDFISNSSFSVDKSEMASAFSSKSHTIKVVKYAYTYRNTDYLSELQGLFRTGAGMEDYKKGDKFKLKVCPLFPKICSPKRNFYEAKIGMLIVVFIECCGFFPYLLISSQ